MTVSATIVNQYYNAIFRTEPSAAISASYEAMANDAAALSSMLSSANVGVDPVIRLYQAAFNRLPDAAGMDYWVGQYLNGVLSITQIAQSFTDQVEFQDDYGALNNAQYVGALYNNVLQRVGDAAGVVYWTNELDQGKLTRAEVLYLFSDSPEFRDATDADVDAFLTNIANTPVADQANPDLYAGNLFDVNGGTPGATYNLTTNIDTIDVTGQKIDVVNGLISAASTYNTGDTVNGNGKTKVELIVNVAAAQTVIADLNDVASIDVNLAVSATGNRATVDMSEFDNVGQVAVTKGTNSQFLNIANAQVDTAYSINVARSVTVDITSFEDDSADDDVVSLSLNGAGNSSGDAAFDLSGEAIETLEVATSGTNFIDLDGGGLVETYTITGGGTNEIEFADGAAVLTINASATTGDNVLVLANGEFSSTDSITGGAGDDTLIAFVEAGTTAATITAIETLEVVIDTPNSFLSGTNMSGVTTLNVLDLSDEVVTLTALKAELSAINISSEALVDALSVTYVRGAESDVTLTLAAELADASVGDITFARNTGNLAVIAAGAGFGSLEDLVANDVASVGLETDGQDLRVDTITANAASLFTFTASVGNGIDADGAGADTVLELNTGAVETVVTEVSLSATGVDSDDNGSSIDLLIDDNGNADDETTVDLITVISDADGTVNLTITENTADSLLIGLVDASGSAGTLLLDMDDLDDENGVEVTLGAGDATVRLTAGDDLVYGGAGDTTITTTAGADTIVGGSGTETIVMSTDDDSIQLEDFTAGESGDIASFDVSEWGTPQDGASAVIDAGDAADIQVLASGAAWDYDAGNILVLTGIIANDAALIIEMETNGSTGAVDTDNILVAYFDGFSTQLRVVTMVDVNLTAIDDVTVTAGGTEIVGVNTTALTDANFAFV